MSSLLALLIAVPFLVAAASVGFRRRSFLVRLVTYAAISFNLGASIVLVAYTAGGDIPVARMGDWPSPYGIMLAGDLFSALMLTVSSFLVLVCTTFAASRGEDQRPFFYQLVLILLAGVSGAFVTADLFNLFVFFEVMLIASYVLLTIDGNERQVRAGAVYVTTNLLASTLLLIGIAVIYGVAGTVNMAALADVVGGSHRATVGGALLLVAFGVKASLVPVHGWLPRSYPAAPPGVAALFSGILSKVGIYAIYRVYSVVFGGDADFRGLLLAVAVVTMVVGVLGAVGRDGMRDILAFHMVSQVGYLIVGLGLFTPLGVAGGIFYMLQYMVVKTSLFLAAGAVETFEGEGALKNLGAVARKHKVVTLGFALAAFSLSGLPPFSGFFAKVMLIVAAFGDTQYWVAGAAIAVSFFTLLSMVKIWNGVFWGDPPPKQSSRIHLPDRALVSVGEGDRGEVEGIGPLRAAGLVGPGVLLAFVSLGTGLGAEGLFELSQRAAGLLLDTAPWVEAVLGA